MSESLNTVRTGSCKARSKGILVTAIPEAGRQREIWNLSNEAQISLREIAGLNMCEPRCSVVIMTPGNWVNGRAEPFCVWRRQHHAPPHPAEVHERSGVAGQACCEGYPREDGRSLILAHSGIKHPNVDQEMDVRTAISVTRETLSNGIREVGKDHINDESSVMGADAKGPCFGQVPNEVETVPYSPKGVSHGR